VTKVFVPNKGAYDYSDAERFGKLIFLTEGTITKYNTNSLHRMFNEGMRGAEEGDYVLISSLPIFNAIVSSILAARFGVVNYLLFRNGVYLERSLKFE